VIIMPGPKRPEIADVQPAPAPPVEPGPAVAPAPPVVPSPIPMPPPAVTQVQPSPAPPLEPGPPVAPVAAPPPTLSELASLTCGRVSARHQGTGNILDGYVGTESDLALVKAIVANVPDTTLGDVTFAPWPQCEAIQTLERPLAVPDRPQIELGAADLLHAGDPLHITIRSPGQISYLYVSYVQADGSVVHLVQPTGLVPQPTLPRQMLSFGDGQNGGATFTVGPPFGREMIIAIAARSPLFDHPLPAQQTEREYLTELRRALIYKPSPDLPDRELSASIKTLQTEAR
jgi:hypothetical protein